MKYLFLLCLLTFHLTGYAADLVTLTRNSGFSPIPVFSQLSIDENGQVNKFTRTHNVPKNENLGQLSLIALQSLKDKIERIDDNAELVDPNPNAPRCMDGPYSSTRINKSGKEITIQLNTSCHTSEVQAVEAEAIIHLLLAFDSLSF